MSLPLIIPPERDAQWRRIISARQEYWRLYSFIAEQLRGSPEIALSTATEVQLHDARIWYDSAAAIAAEL